MSAVAASPSLGSSEGRVFFFCIGAQKAATTWLASQLMRHPEIYVSDPKEMHYWDTIRSPHNFAWRHVAGERIYAKILGVRSKLRARFLPSARHAMERARAYRALLEAGQVDHGKYVRYLVEGAGEKRVIGDITPDYALLRRDTFEEMLTIHPSARFMFILRDPYDRMLSGVRHLNQPRHGCDPSTEAAHLDKALLAAVTNPHDYAFRFSNYLETMRELHAVVPSDRILYLFYENIGRPDTASMVGDFLGVSDLELDATSVVHRSRETDWKPSEEIAARARAALMPVYAAIAEKHWDQAVPDWVQQAGRMGSN